jgi:hypothetical protein
MGIPELNPAPRPYVVLTAAGSGGMTDATTNESQERALNRPKGLVEGLWVQVHLRDFLPHPTQVRA